MAGASCCAVPWPGRQGCRGHGVEGSGPVGDAEPARVLVVGLGEPRLSLIAGAAWRLAGVRVASGG
jgi:hypothetical protein